MNWYNIQLKIAMPKWIRWTDDQIETIKKLVNEGKSFSEIARMFNVHKKSISILNDKYKWRDLKQDRRAWEGTLYRMVGRGALWTEEEINTMADYLVQINGPQ